MKDIRYVIITPVRDEEVVIEKTLQSVVNQSIYPKRWIFVNDNSIDNTKEIIQSWMKDYPFIEVYDYPYSTERLPGTGVIRAFDFGIKKLKDINNFDFIVKLDADLSFSKTYFENIFGGFKKNSKLGIASGMIYELNGKVVKKNIIDHPYGASKIYSINCFKNIYPFDFIKSWDLLDNIKANVAGFETKIILNEKVIHHKPMESAVGKLKENRLKGYYAAFLRYNTLFVFLKGLSVSIEEPYIIGGIMYYYGYFKNLFVERSFYKDKKVTNFIKKQQIIRLKRMIRFEA